MQHPQFHRDPEFHPQPGGEANPEQQEIGDMTLKSLLAREAGQPETWGSPAPL